MNDQPIPLPPCPACGGAYLYGLTFQHRTSCRFYGPDSATAAADHEKREGVRPLTPTEKELIQDEYDSPKSPNPSESASDTTESTSGTLSAATGQAAH